MNTKKILMVIAPRDFRDVEYNTPKKIILENGFTVDTASIQKIKAVGADGTEVDADKNISEVNVNDYEAVVFIGGPGMAEITGDESLQVAAYNFYKAGKLTAAICVAPEILAKAGILEGKNVAAFSGSEEILKNNGANFKNEKVVTDGNLITANGPEAAEDFGQAVVSYLKNN